MTTKRHRRRRSEVADAAHLAAMQAARTILEIVFRAGELEVKEPSGAIELQRTVGRLLR